MVPKTNIKRIISLRPIAYFSFFFGIFNGHSFCNALMTLSEIKSSTLICAVHFFGKLMKICFQMLEILIFKMEQNMDN